MGNAHGTGRFAGFRSASSIPRLQPDPSVLTQLDRRLQAFENECTKLDFSKLFIKTMIDLYVEAFTALDSIDRNDPFWDGTNRRPTQYKLISYCDHATLADPRNVLIFWHRVSIRTVGAWFFDPEDWENLNRVDSVDPKWIVNSALHSESFGSYQTANCLADLLKRNGLCDQVSGYLNEMLLLDHVDLPSQTSWPIEKSKAQWAKQVLCG